MPTATLPTKAEIEHRRLALQVKAQNLLEQMLESYAFAAETSGEMDDQHKLVDRLIKLSGAEPSKKEDAGAGRTILQVSINASSGVYGVQAHALSKPEPDEGVVDVEAREPAQPESQGDPEPLPAPEPAQAYRTAPNTWDFSQLDAMVSDVQVRG